ncbi:MAG: translocation/assembly module TamB domain-containing protein [Taibaiella sp.]|nr:translocation/assembly module TamB domain-containing protein [Taibaiella sp.]
MIRKAFKITLWIIGSIILLLVVAVLCLNSQWGQNIVRGKAETFLTDKLKTEVRIGFLGVGFPKYLVIKDVLLKDQVQDTLLLLGELKVDIDMMALIRKNVDVQHLILTGVHSHVYRKLHDTDFNFSYIIHAFAGDKPTETKKPKDTTAKPMNISIGKVLLQDIHVRFDDYTGGTRMAVNLDELSLKMKKLDLEKMLFHIKELSVSGLQGEFIQDTSYLPSKPHQPGKTDIQLIADDITLDKVAFKYNDQLNKFLFALNLGTLHLQLNKFGLADNLVDVEKLAIDKTDIALVMGSRSGTPDAIDTIIKKDSTEGWNVRVAEVQLTGVNFRMENENSPHLPKGIDYSHLNLKKVAIDLRDAVYTSDSLSGNLKHLAATDQSGVVVKELKTKFRYNGQGAVLDELYLETPNTTIQDHLEVHYPSLAALKDSIKTLQLNINLVSSRVAVSDILLFVPQLEEQKMFKENRNSLLKIETKVTGYLDNLNIAKLYVSGLTNTEVLLTGKLRGVPDAEKISYDLNIVKLQSSAKDVSTFVPDSVLAAIRIPDRFVITGQLAGTIKDYRTNINLSSSDGLAYVRGTLAMSPGKGKEKYDMVVSTAELNIGRILRQDSLLGPVSAHFIVKGSGFDPKMMTAAIDGNIISALLKGYRYHDISLFGKMATKRADIDLMSNDPNVHILVKGHADFSGKYAAAKADIQIDSIDLQALKLYKTELRASGTIHADFPVLNPDYPQGKFIWWQPIVTANGKRYYLDSLYVISRPSDTGQNIIADLGVLTASITGRMPLTQVAPAIKEHISRHYRFPADSSALKGTATTKADTNHIPKDYALNIKADVLDKPMLRGILPGLTSFDSIHIGASITPRILKLDVSVPDLVYGTTTIENGIVAVRATDAAFTYKITVNNISQGSISLWATSVFGRIDQDSLTTNVSIADAAGIERFAIAADMQKKGDSQVLHLKPGFKLDYRNWAVAQPNRIVLAKGGFYVHNFAISDSGQEIKAMSATTSIDAPLKVNITNFMLSNITQAISSSDTLIAAGLLGGTIDIAQFKPSLKLTSDLKIIDLSLLGDTLGNLEVHVNNNQAQTIEARVKLTEHDNDIAINGLYYLKQENGNDFNFDINVNALAVKSIESITKNQIRNSSGYVRGKLNLKGTAKAPKIIGELHTDKLITTVAQINAVFRMPEEKIEFTENRITLNDFTIHDDDNNKANLNGTIDISDLTKMDMDMKLRATKWRALHSTIKDNKIFFGDLWLTTNLSIKGNPMGPKVEGDLKILKGTDVTVINPESNTEIESRKGIVRFVNMKDTGRRNILKPKKKNSTQTQSVAGADINVNIAIDKSAAFTLILDKSSGDFLSVKGDATINAALTPTGNISLTGSYALTDGSYQLNYNLVKRRFKLAKGSMITFAGDPVKGTMLDLTAVYETQVAPYDLVQRQITDPAQLNFYKQRLPFDVNLYMRGPVLKPRLTFDVMLTESRAYKLSADQIDVVQGKLSQIRTDTSEMNKQVFALLILNRFVSDDPFSNNAGSSASFTALQSVSTFIGEQLNRAAGKLVKGVDFSVDLATTEDYTSGSLRQRTDLNLAASKQLLNDRLKLTLGNNFELDGPQSANGNQSSFVPSNLAADYLLSADGKYTLRAYRRAYDVGVLQGFVTETGLNFIVSFDYNKFKKALKPAKSEAAKQKEREERIKSREKEKAKDGEDEEKEEDPKQ